MCSLPVSTCYTQRPWPAAGPGGLGRGWGKQPGSNLQSRICTPELAQV